MGALDVVDLEYDNNVIISTQAFKLKQYPDGIIKKVKDILCARGDMQLEGIYFFETYAPVVQCTTIRLMLIIEAILKLKSNKCDITAAFIHAKIEENEKVFLEMPRGFEQYDKRGKRRVPRLKKTRYGICQSPRVF